MCVKLKIVHVEDMVTFNLIGTLCIVNEDIISSIVLQNTLYLRTCSYLTHVIVMCTILYM